MALRTPPSWLQNGSHPAENDRLTTQALYSTTGTIGASSLAITAQASPNMTVNAASGWCAIAGSTANSGVYVAYNDAVTVLTITAANPSLPRIDRVVVTVSDAYYSGATNTVAFSVITGTAAASPTAPATPSNSISLATIAVAAGATTVQAANITDTRTGATSSAFLPLTGGTVSGSVTVTGALTASSTTTLSGAVAVSGALTSTNTITTSSTVTSNGFIATASAGTIPSIQLTSGTLTSGVIGGLEFSQQTLWYTPGNSSGTGNIPTEFFYTVGTAASLVNGTSAQSLFPLGIYVSTGRYDVEINAQLTTGSTAHNTSFTMDAPGTYTSQMWTSISSQGNTAAPVSVTSLVGTAVNLFSGTSTATTTNLFIKGSFTVASGPTLIQPRITFSVAPGGTNQINVGSVIRIRKYVSVGQAGAWA